jgi:hypothetical protein
MAIKDVVAENERRAAFPDKVPGDNESVGNSPRLILRRTRASPCAFVVP